jgi:hypothetical protein
MLAGRPHQRESNGSFPRAHKKNEKVAAFFRSLVSMRTFANNHDVMLN